MFTLKQVNSITCCWSYCERSYRVTRCALQNFKYNLSAQLRCIIIIRFLKNQLSVQDNNPS